MARSPSSRVHRAVRAARWRSCSRRRGRSVDAPAPDKIAVLRARRGNETHAYYFGDTVYDMQSARAAGYTPIAVDRGYTDTGILRQAGATAVLTTFDELPSVLAHPMTTTQRR